LISSVCIVSPSLRNGKEGKGAGEGEKEKEEGEREIVCYAGCGAVISMQSRNLEECRAIMREKVGAEVDEKTRRKETTRATADSQRTTGSEHIVDEAGRGMGAAELSRVRESRRGGG
jgi:hypothetical protein